MGEIILDDWQKEIIADETHHIGLTKGRRIGATHLFAIKAVEWLKTHHNPHPTSQIVCSSITSEQAQLIIAFATNYAQKKYPKLIGKGKDKPTLNRLILVVNKNRRILLAKPVGDTGASARGFEGQVLMVDEAPFQPDLFFEAAKPILATTGGRIWMWGTFNGRQGYFWENYEKSVIKKDPKARFKFWEKNTEQVLAERPISSGWTEEQRESLRQHLEEEKNDMSDKAYAQEYLGIAALDKNQFYSDEWIKSICTLDKTIKLTPGDCYGGFDLARMGGDQFTAEIIKHLGNEKYKQADHFTKKMLLTTENEDLVAEFTRKWKCDKSGIDAGAGTLGVSVLDHLKIYPQFSDIRKRIIPLNNRALSERYEEGKQKFFNEDMHDNLKKMGELSEIQLFNDEEIKASLRSVQWDLVEDSHGLSKVRIYGRFTHIAEGLIRAAWLAKKEKSKNLHISYI